MELVRASAVNVQVTNNSCTTSSKIAINLLSNTVVDNLHKTLAYKIMHIVEMYLICTL